MDAYRPDDEYKFTIPIGDLSGDGHGKCEYYLVTSNKPVGEVREIHYKIKDVTGIDIHSFASEYEDDEIPGDVVEKLRDLGYDVEGIDKFDDTYWATADDMFSIWIFLLMQTDKDLIITKEKEPPMLSFYGFDDKHRHIDFVGYGCL